MKEKYKRIRKELFALNPRFRKMQTKIVLKFVLKVTPLELLVAAFAAAAYAMAPGVVIAFPVIGFYAFWIIFKKDFLSKNALYGTVTTIGRDNLMVKSDNIRWMKQQNFTIYTITTPDGKKEELILPIPYERVFKKGDKIIRLSGMEYPVDLTPEEMLICPFCGNIFPTENKDCIECGEPALNATVIDGIK